MKGRTVILGALLAGLVPAAASAQSTDTTAVLAVVQRLFDAMRARDTSTIRAAFHPDARLIGAVRGRDGTPAVRVTTLDDFVRGIGSATRFLDERLYETEVRIDGGLATVWARYDFYADSTLSHCGVDAVQLARADTAWLIIHIADTRRREGCGPH
jgi:hypothetical protein